MITGSLKSKPDRRALMVEYRSITPWMMFTSASLPDYWKTVFMQNWSLPTGSRCIVGTGFLKSSFNYGDSGHETRMQSIWFHARRSSKVSAHRYLKRLRIACDLRFENRQRLCSWTACLSGSAASNWMQFRLCNFVPSHWIHLIINTDPQNRASRCQ